MCNLKVWHKCKGEFIHNKTMQKLKVNMGPESFLSQLHSSFPFQNFLIGITHSLLLLRAQGGNFMASVETAYFEVVFAEKNCW
jgi:hypothetical protein